jgi:hypothetical protein
MYVIIILKNKRDPDVIGPYLQSEIPAKKAELTRHGMKFIVKALIKM